MQINHSGLLYRFLDPLMLVQKEKTSAGEQQQIEGNKKEITVVKLWVQAG